MHIDHSENVIFTNIVLSFCTTCRRNTNRKRAVRKPWLIASLALKSSIILCKAPVLDINFLSSKQVSCVWSLRYFLGPVHSAAGKDLQKETSAFLWSPLLPSGTWALPSGKAVHDSPLVYWIWLGSLTFLNSSSFYICKQF